MHTIYFDLIHPPTPLPNSSQVHSYSLTPPHHSLCLSVYLFKTSHYEALALLEFTVFVDQVSLKVTDIHLLHPPSAEIKSIHHYI